MSDLPCDKYHLRQIKRCCGTCKHFSRIYEGASCEHPEHCDNVFVDEGFICDLWEKKVRND